MKTIFEEPVVLESHTIPPERAPWTRVLCLVEFSDSGYKTLHYADALARSFGAALTLLHVATPEQLRFSMASPGGERFLGFSGGRGRTVHVAEQSRPAGSAAPDILRVARKERHDLIVLPGPAPEQRPGFRPMIGAVLASAKCPVLTAGKDPAGHAASLQRPVVCAVGLDEDAPRLIQYASEVARGLPAPLSLVCASGETHVPSLYDKDWNLTSSGRIHDRLYRLREQCGVDAGIILEPGALEEAVPAAAARLRAGLIITGRRRPKRLLERVRALVPAIPLRSPCPVIHL
jgi:nucleotide-binding universal stress UspA family protein